MSNIVDFADAAATQLAHRYAGDPEAEFLAWLQVALRREAMVSEAYDDHFVRSHIRMLKKRGLSRPVAEIIRRSLASAWTQEIGHKYFLAAVLKRVNPPKTFFKRLSASCQDVLGAIEGKTIGNLVSGDSFEMARARIALAIGSLVNDVPEFVKDIHRMSFSDFASLNADLEETAMHGYKRMSELFLQLNSQSASSVETTLRWDLDRLLRDETYHHELFTMLAQLFNGPPPGGLGSPTGRINVSALTSVFVRGQIVAAQMSAYSGDQREAARTAGNRIMVYMTKISRDPVIIHLRRWAEHQRRLERPTQREEVGGGTMERQA
jgi:hypothetical protein